MQFLVLLIFAASLQGIILTYLIDNKRLKELKSVVLGIAMDYRFNIKDLLPVNTENKKQPAYNSIANGKNKYNR